MTDLVLQLCLLLMIYPTVLLLFIIQPVPTLLSGAKRQKLQHGPSNWNGHPAHPIAPLNPINVMRHVDEQFSDSDSDDPEETFDDVGGLDSLLYVVGEKPLYRSDDDMRTYSDFEGKKPSNGYFAGGMCHIYIYGRTISVNSLIITTF